VSDRYRVIIVQTVLTAGFGSVFFATGNRLALIPALSAVAVGSFA